MKDRVLLLLWLLPFLASAQQQSGKLSVGVQFYKNISLPDNYEGFGVGLNSKLNLTKGFAFDATYFYEVNDILSAGSLKRLQRGLSVSYTPFYQKKVSPWVEIGAVFNTIMVMPVSYLFVDNALIAIKQNYFTANFGIGGICKLNSHFALNAGLYFQPQNYSPNYLLNESENGPVLETNIASINLKVDPLIYINLGLTYQIAKLW